MAIREGVKVPIVGPAVAEPPPEMFTQRKRAEVGRFRLLVDRQLKSSYGTADAAHVVGLAIKQGHPVVQVAIYDSVEGVNTAIELPSA